MGPRRYTAVDPGLCLFDRVFFDAEVIVLMPAATDCHRHPTAPIACSNLATSSAWNALADASLTRHLRQDNIASSGTHQERDETTVDPLPFCCPGRREETSEITRARCQASTRFRHLDPACPGSFAAHRARCRTSAGRSRWACEGSGRHCNDANRHKQRHGGNRSGPLPDGVTDGHPDPGETIPLERPQCGRMSLK
jgi:hypothetical protein